MTYTPSNTNEPVIFSDEWYVAFGNSAVTRRYAEVVLGRDDFTLTCRRGGWTVIVGPLGVTKPTLEQALTTLKKWLDSGNE